MVRYGGGGSSSSHRSPFLVGRKHQQVSRTVTPLVAAVLLLGAAPPSNDLRRLTAVDLLVENGELTQQPLPFLLHQRQLCLAKCVAVAVALQLRGHFC